MGMLKQRSGRRRLESSGLHGWIGLRPMQVAFSGNKKSLAMKTYRRTSFKARCTTK